MPLTYYGKISLECTDMHKGDADICSLSQCCTELPPTLSRNQSKVEKRSLGRASNMILEHIAPYRGSAASQTASSDDSVKLLKAKPGTSKELPVLLVEMQTQ